MEKWKRDFPKVEYPPNDCKFCTERHDYWAHSYYRKASLKNRDYKNRRPEYLENFFEKLINWEFVESQLD